MRHLAVLHFLSPYPVPVLWEAVVLSDLYLPTWDRRDLHAKESRHPPYLSPQWLSATCHLLFPEAVLEARCTIREALVLLCSQKSR